MKKLFLSAAVLAALASCSKDVVTNVAPSQQGSQIGFTTLNDRVSKAATSNYDGYHVYSVSTAADYAAKFYITEDVSTADAIMSGNVYYWPLGAQLAFYAYAPSTVSATATVAANAATITIDDYTVVGNEDLTVATPIASGVETENDVDLEFKHMLSKVTINVVLSESLTDAGYVLETRELVEGYPAENTYTTDFGVAYDQNTLNVVTGAWSGTAAQSGAAAPVYTAANSYMVLPQANDGTSLYIQIKGLTLVDNAGAATSITDMNLAKYIITTTDLAEMAAGTHYIFTITVDGTSDNEDDEDILSPIKFASTVDADWTTEVEVPVTATGTEA